MTKSRTIQLLVRADDAGSSWSANMGCFEACEKGIARSVEVMMPGAWVMHAAKLFNTRTVIDIGIHLTLTSEWDAVKWRPLTHVPSLVDEHGYFYPLFNSRKGDNRPCLADANWSTDDIAQELEEQITLGLNLFKSVSHVSSHMLNRFRDFDTRVGEIVADLCHKFKLSDDVLGEGIPRIQGYPKFPRDSQQRVLAFIEQLSRLRSGTYLFIDHPAVDSQELKQAGHIGYEDVAIDRITCLETLTSDRVIHCIKDLNIELISYRDLLS